MRGCFTRDLTISNLFVFLKYLEDSMHVHLAICIYAYECMYKANYVYDYVYFYQSFVYIGNKRSKAPTPPGSQVENHKLFK